MITLIFFIWLIIEHLFSAEYQLFYNTYSSANFAVRWTLPSREAAPVADPSYAPAETVTLQLVSLQETVISPVCTIPPQSCNFTHA
jgi:hypothetical protein